MNFKLSSLCELSSILKCISEADSVLRSITLSQYVISWSNNNFPAGDN